MSPWEPRARAAPLHIMKMLLDVAILAEGVHLGLVLYMDGYALSRPLVPDHGQRIAPPAVLLMCLHHGGVELPDAGEGERALSPRAMTLL
jgi:hypothetical protein